MQTPICRVFRSANDGGDIVFYDETKFKEYEQKTQNSRANTTKDSVVLQQRHQRTIRKESRSI